MRRINYYFKKTITEYLLISFLHRGNKAQTTRPPFVIFVHFCGNHSLLLVKKSTQAIKRLCAFKSGIKPPPCAALRVARLSHNLYDDGDLHSEGASRGRCLPLFLPDLDEVFIA